MKLKQIFAAAALSLATAVSFAAPIYSGDKTASGLSNSDIETGYYIWKDGSAGTNTWSIRWSSTDAVPGNRVDWFGSVTIDGAGLGDVSPFRFESNGSDLLDVDRGFFNDQIEWLTVTNDKGGIDGIDFTLGNTVKSLQFRLGSSLFADLDPAYGGNGVDGSYIFLGDTFATPDVFVYDSPYGVYQSFEVAVSEPGTIALLGLGLAGLGFARRQQAKA